MKINFQPFKNTIIITKRIRVFKFIDQFLLLTRLLENLGYLFNSFVDLITNLVKKIKVQINDMIKI